MSNKDEPNKIGKMVFNDEHIVLRFNIEDRPYINEKYISRIVRYNQIIEDMIDELNYMKIDLRKMEHSTGLDRKLWSFPRSSVRSAAAYYNAFEALEISLQSMVENKMRVVRDFHENTLRHHDDKTPRDKKFEPDSSAEAKDLVVLTGVAEAARQITHETTRTWDFFGLGRSQVPADFDNEDLFSPIGRYFIKTHGTFAAIGEVIRLLVVSPDDMATEDIAELCIADLPSGGNILLRAVLDNKVRHEANQHFLASSANIYLASRR